jgi:hypothetical protein
VFPLFLLFVSFSFSLQVHTNDGYLLALQCISYPTGNIREQLDHPVLLQHGLFMVNSLSLSLSLSLRKEKRRKNMFIKIGMSGVYVVMQI